MIVVNGAPVRPANIPRLVGVPESSGSTVPGLALKYTIILSPGLNEVGPCACVRQIVGLPPTPSKSRYMSFTVGHCTGSKTALLFNVPF